MIKIMWINNRFEVMSRESIWSMEEMRHKQYSCKSRSPVPICNSLSVVCRCVSISLFRCASRSIASENYDGNAVIRSKIPWFTQMKICSLAPGFVFFERDGNSCVRIKSDIAHFQPNCFRCLRVTHKTTNMADNGRFCVDGGRSCDVRVTVTVRQLQYYLPDS